MLIRYIAKYRHIITAVIAVLFIGSMVYFGIRSKNKLDVSMQSKSYSGEAMGTAIKKTLYITDSSSSDEMDKIDDMIDDCLKNLENQISVRIAESEVASCNRNYAVGGRNKLSGNVIAYLKDEIQINKETKGAFSPCIRPIAELWGIEDGQTLVPDDTTIAEVLERTNADNIGIIEDSIVFYADGMAIDFGAVGKGIACDEVAEQLKTANVRGAVVSIGGSILAYGDKGDDKPWHIGIQDPRAEEGEMFGVVDVKGNKVISTSGDYEKYFEQDGKRYHHIFNPATGYPADSGLISVTIISESGFLSDALSTACFVMGLEEGIAYAEEKNVDAIFVTTDKKVYVTKEIRKSFRLQSNDYKLEKTSNAQ